MFSAGDCLHIETNPNAFNEIKAHLHVVIIDIIPTTGETIIVPVETHTSEKQDGTTFLYTGDHQFIKQKSYVNYRRARIHTKDDLQNWIDTGIAKKMKPLEADVLQRVKNGVIESKRTFSDVKDLLNQLEQDRIDDLFNRLN